MNKFDERYDIRLAYTSDIDDIMCFIDEYWKKGHIMSQDKELFRYEYANGDNINFVLAIDKGTHSIEGIFGFIDCSYSRDKGKRDIWGSIWKVKNPQENIPLLGIELAKRVYCLTGCRSHIGNGANPNTTVPLRRMFFGDKVVRMKQYYRLNPYISEYEIAIARDKCILPEIDPQNETMLHEFKSIQEVKNCFDIDSIDAIPYKDSWYVNKRYFCHPYYKYKVLGLSDSTEKIAALLMAREFEHNGKRAFRIVDYIGDHKLFAGLGRYFDSLLKDYSYEYIDFYTFGFDEEAVIKAGLKLRENGDPNVIPNYFEPFLRENVDIWAHYKLEGTTFFKADGDQDRPNLYKKTNSTED